MTARHPADPNDPYPEPDQHLPCPAWVDCPYCDRGCVLALQCDDVCTCGYCPDVDDCPECSVDAETERQLQAGIDALKTGS